MPRHVPVRSAVATRPPAARSTARAPARPAPRPARFGRRSLAALEAQSRAIRDPVEKLRFLRRSLERFERLDERLQALPGAPLRWVAYRLTGVEDARPLFSQNPMGALDPPRRSRPPLPRRARRAANVAAVLLTAAAGLALASYPRSHAPEPAAPVAKPKPRPAVEAALDAPKGGTPERIWLVDSGAAFELYSNGLRIDTTWAVRGEPRRYRVFSREAGMGGEVYDRPVGIVFHTSESDIWPLEEEFNQKLRDSSQDLLRYLRRNQVYHYLIDRFGRVYRVVEEKDKANHAGMSVWGAGGRVFLNLNGATIGVSFETRWEGGAALPITRAQLEAGRSLTDYLRHKWSLAPEMCVTHGLASVNPKKHLIGHHLDWARGFPFAAYSLPDQYQVPAPAVQLFGFGYDERFLSVLGEPWPGVTAAQAALRSEAEAAGRDPDAVKAERVRTYDRWLAELTKDAETAERAAAQGARAASGG